MTLDASRPLLTQAERIIEVDKLTAELGIPVSPEAHLRLESGDHITFQILLEDLKALKEDRPYSISSVDMSRVVPGGEIVLSDWGVVSYTGNKYCLQMYDENGVSYMREVVLLDGGREKDGEISFASFEYPGSRPEIRLMRHSRYAPSTHEMQGQYVSGDEEFNLARVFLNFGRFTGVWGPTGSRDILEVDLRKGCALFWHNADMSKEFHVPMNAPEGEFAVLRQSGNYKRVEVRVDTKDVDKDRFIIVTLRITREINGEDDRVEDVQIARRLRSSLYIPGGFTPTPFADAKNPTHEEAEALDAALKDLWEENKPEFMFDE